MKSFSSRAHISICQNAPRPLSLFKSIVFFKSFETNFWYSVFWNVFLEIIGQRRGFSVGDHQKINRLYNCSRPLLNSVTAGFDDDYYWNGFMPKDLKGDQFYQVKSGNCQTTM